MSGQNLCLRCMATMGENSSCPDCGWSDDAIYDLQYIKPGTVLSGRYLMGYPTRKNSEGAVYAGYDNATQHRVWVREYFPITLAQRALDTGKISPLPGCGAQYKALMSDFVDNCNEVKRLSVTEPVVPIENVFSENNTVYAIFKGLELVSLEAFLKGEGALDCKRALSLLTPICNTLGILHSHGQIHRGISPYTIYVDEYDNLYLWDFALSATRTSGSELDAELFSGYTAPEQYSPNGWQGSWTDVYAMGAVLYRALTGIVPPKSIRIGQERALRTVSDLRPETPDFISDAIAEAMAVPTEGRIQTIQTLTTRLVESELSNTAVYDVGRVVREATPPADRPVRRRRKGSDAKYVLIGLAAMLVLLVGVMTYVMRTWFPGVINPADPATTSQEPEESGEEEGNTTGLVQGTVPGVVGRTYAELIADPAYTGLFTFTKKEDFRDNIADGVIYDQAPAEGTAVMGHATVVVYVSKGVTKVKIPSIGGRKLDEAIEILRGVDILSYNLVEQYSSAEPNTVLRVVPEAGSEIDPKTTTLTIYYAKEQVVEGTSKPDDDDDIRWNNPDIIIPGDNGNGTPFR